MKPIRIQRSRQHKQVSPNGLPIVYVGRPSCFGNPFVKGEWAVVGKGGDGMKYLVCKKQKYADSRFKYMKTTEDAVNMYREMLARYPLNPKEIELLKGKNLSCWCKIGEKCHGDVLLELVNK